MKLDANVTVTFRPSEMELHVSRTLERLERRLEALARLVAALNRRETTMALDFTQLKATVTDIKGAEASTKEVVMQVAANQAALSAKIQALIDAGGAIDPAELQAINDDLAATAQGLKDDNAAIAASVVANPVP